LKRAQPVQRIKSYDSILDEVVGLLEAARRTSARVVNAVMTSTYWQIGRRIVEAEQEGAIRAAYGEHLIERLSTDLTHRFGRGFSKRNVEQMRAFYLGWPITQMESAQSEKRIAQNVSAQLAMTRSRSASVLDLSTRFPLPWSHYVKLLSVKNELARQFYEAEALRGGWSVKQLDRQINSQFYERTALSRNKTAMLTKHNRAQPDDCVTPEQEIKDPFVLEFLGLRDEYSESDLEEALVGHLESFLLELGSDFTFVGRQKRLRVGDAWYRIDLLFFHRRLRCLVIIDVKTGAFTHADAGQMHLSCNYAKSHWMHPGENPPVGLILCAQAEAAVARYSLDGLPSKVLAAEYRTALPDEKLLADEIDKTRRALESRAAARLTRKTRTPHR